MRGKREEGRGKGGDLALRAKMGSNFKRPYLENSKSQTTQYGTLTILTCIRSIDWNRFKGSTMTYKAASGSGSGIGPWTTENDWE